MIHPAYLVLPSLVLVVACKQPQSDPYEHAHHDRQEHAGEHENHPPQHSHQDHAGVALPADTPLAGASLYHLDAAFTDQHGATFELESLRGSAVLTAMFYASCTSVCPMLIAQVKRAHDALPEGVRGRTHVLLVTLDPARDTTEKLAALADRHGIRSDLFHFVRTNETNVRTLAALLGIRYRALPDGEISHSPVLALLDREGALAMRMENAGSDVAPLVAAAKRVYEGATP
jgi:protein SCO1/2